MGTTGTFVLLKDKRVMKVWSEDHWDNHYHIHSLDDVFPDLNLSIVSESECIGIYNDLTELMS